MQRHQLRLLALTALAACAAALPSAAQGSYALPVEDAQVLAQLMPAPELLARARIGNAGPGGIHELTLGSPQTPNTDKAHLGWKSGVSKPFRMTYDGLGTVSLLVGSKWMQFATVGDFEAIAVSAHSPGPASRARAFELELNGVPLLQSATAYSPLAGGDFSALLISRPDLNAGFVLEGKLELAWFGSAPKHSLRVKLQVGRLTEQVEGFCTSTPNSTGQSCSMQWWGTTSVSTNAFRLVAENGPPNAVCLYLVGATTQALPYGNGTLCVGAPIERLADFFTLDALGRIELQLDLLSGPFATGPLGALPGDTRAFQVWYRDSDAGAGSFNLSDALLAHFLP